MLKRLIVLVAALAMVFVFVSTSSAGETPSAPTECVNVGTVTALTECLEALEAPGGLDVPEACTDFLDPANLPDNLLNPTAALTACLSAITDLLPDEGDEGYGYDDYGYDGYDYGYDVGYDDAVPDGGIASGFGPTGSDAAGAPLAARGGALLAVLGVLGTGLLIMRRRHGS